MATLLRQGRRLVLAFYTEDATPACETEVGLLRESYDMIVEFGASVLAVSADGLESHLAFAARMGGLPFPLASDEDLSVAHAFGVPDAETKGRSGRALFVIDRDGIILLSLPRFQPGNLAHVEAMFTALGAEV